MTRTGRLCLYFGALLVFQYFLLTHHSWDAISQSLPFPGPGAAAAPPAGPPLTNMVLWYSADCITFTSSVCGVPADNTSVTAWADRSGNGHDLSKSSGTCTFHTSQVNGKPAVTFSNCHLDFTQVSNLDFRVIFVVLKNAVTGGSLTFFTGGDSSLSYVACYLGKQQGLNETGHAANTQGAASCDTNWHQMNAWIITGGGTVWRLDRASDGSGGAFGLPNPQSGVGFYPGVPSIDYNGQISELVWYQSSSSSPPVDVSAVETYLFNKYGL